MNKLSTLNTRATKKEFGNATQRTTKAVEKLDSLASNLSDDVSQFRL